MYLFFDSFLVGLLDEHLFLQFYYYLLYKMY